MEPESLQLEKNSADLQDSTVRAEKTPAVKTSAQDLAAPVSSAAIVGDATGSANTHVLTLDEIATLAAEEGQPAETLMNVVALIAKRFETEVCSAYLLEPDRANLVLAATIGLRPECIGNLRMAIHEGLAGVVAEKGRTAAVEQ